MGPNEATPRAVGGTEPARHFSTTLDSIAAVLEKWRAGSVPPTALGVVFGSSVGRVTCARISSGPVPSVQTHFVPPISTPASIVTDMPDILPVAVGDTIAFLGVAHRSNERDPGLRLLRMTL